MTNLQLPLIEKWFKMTASAIKLEDYREITPYWCNRFLLYWGEKKPKAFWKEKLKTHGPNLLKIKPITVRLFSFNIMTLGYPKKTDLKRILKLSHKGIGIRTGNIEWGADPNKLYFVIKHDNTD